MLSHGVFVVLNHVMYTTYDLISIVIVVTDLLVLVFIFIVFICNCILFELLTYSQECKCVVSIMAWMATVPPREPMVRDSAAQTSDG